jgi:hypothetical protein
MSSAGKVTGFREVMENLNERIANIENSTLDGLFAAGLFLQGEAQKLCPVDTGNLRGSAYTRRESKKSVEVGFGAVYAAPVHEDLEAHHEVGQAKFLETPMKERQSEMLAIIQERATL